MTDRHRTELVRRPKDSGKCTWTDHVGRFSTKHLHFKVKMPKRKVAARQMPPPQTGQPDDGQHDQEKEEPSQPQINPEQAEAIAQFFEDNTLFYDLTHKDYKDRAKRNALLKEFGDQIGLDPDRIWTKFTNMRTDFFKLKKKLKGKSGDGLTRITALQKYKLERYAFLATHYRGVGDDNISSSCLGSVVVPDDHDDEPDEESVFSEQSFGAELAGGSTVPPISDPLRKKPKTNVVKKNMSEVLSQFLAESRRELQESRASIAEASTNGFGTNERDAWVNLLGSLQRDIPKEYWRQYQRETFDVAMKYLTPQNMSQSQQQLLQQHPHMMPFQQVYQPQMTVPPQQQNYPVLFQVTTPQSTRYPQSQPLSVPIQVQSPPVTSSSTSNLLGLAITALNSTSSPYSLSDSAIDQTQPDTDD